MWTQSGNTQGPEKSSSQTNVMLLNQRTSLGIKSCSSASGVCFTSCVNQCSSFSSEVQTQSETIDGRVESSAGDSEDCTELRGVSQRCGVIRELECDTTEAQLSSQMC